MSPFIVPVANGSRSMGPFLVGAAQRSKLNHTLEIHWLHMLLRAVLTLPGKGFIIIAFHEGKPLKFGYTVRGKQQSGLTLQVLF